MLDLMRRKKRLKGVLWVVIFALSMGMLLFFVPGQNIGVSSLDSSAASVAGKEIPMKEFSDAYRRLLDSYSQGGRSRIDPEMAKTLGLTRQTLDSLINVRVMEYAAEQLGLTVTAQEVREAVEANPNMQDRGAFIGVDRYKALLAANNLTVTQFENSIRQTLMAKKVYRIISDSMDVTPRQLRDEFERTNVEAQVNFVVVKKEDLRKKATPAEADARAYFEAHKDKYKIPEERRAQYLLLPTEAVAATMTVSDQDLQAEWAKQPKDEMVDASHILIKAAEPSKDAEAEAKALDVLKKARAGVDFGELARKYSDDTGSKSQGGNLGPFPRGKNVKEFEDAAFKLKPGEVSDLVKSQFGYHIIKVLKHSTPTLESERATLERNIRLDKAAALLKQKTQEAQRLAESQKDLNAIAKALNIPTEVRDTGFVARSSDAFATGLSQALVDEIFKIKDVNSLGKMAEMPLGYALPKLMEVHLPKPPDFAQGRAAAEKDYIEQKASDLAKAEAQNISDEAAQAGDLEKVAKKFGLTAKSTAAFKRDGAADPDLAGATAFNAAAFEKAVGQVSGPISLDGGNRFAVLQVKARTPFDEAALNKQVGDLRERILLQTRDMYFEEYLRRLTESLKNSGKIRINPNAIDQVAQVRY
jgi:peptidyl-prolyl cis-trans isomerase D